MPDELKKNTFTFDEVAFAVKIKTVKENLLIFAGKPGYNPFLTIANKVSPLEVKFNNGDRSEELYTKTMALKEDEEPVVVSENIGKPVKEVIAAGASHNAGQIIMGQGTPQLVK